MQLNTVSKPVNPGTEAGAVLRTIRERLTSAPGAGPLALSETARRRIVVGKSRLSIVPPPETGLESVFNADERTRIVSTRDNPWKLVCALSIDSPMGTLVGTAWFVGSRTLVTAGHCVYDRFQMGGWAREITVTPGQDRDLKPYGSKVATRFSTVDAWQERQDPDYDLAAIHLDEPFFDESEVFQVGSFPDEVLQDYMVNVSGFPAAPGGGTELWWAKNRIRAVTPRRIFYDVDTSGGQSGGPVYLFPDETSRPIVVGIHAYGEGGTPANIGLRVNSAPRIIPEVVDMIEEWRAVDSTG